MKKNLIWIVLAIAVVVGLVMFMGGDKAPNDMTGTEDEVEEKGADLSGAFAGAGSVKCEYKDTSGTNTTVLIKAGMAKITADADGTKGYILYRDDKVYVWNSALAGTGFVYTSAELQGADANTGVFSRSAFESEIKNQNTNCADATITDSEFTIPSTVKFQSISALLKQ